MAEANPIGRAVERADKLRKIAGLLGRIPEREAASRAVGRVAETLELAVEQRRAGTLSEKSEVHLTELLDRLDESTWNGKKSRTKNDVLRQASYGVFPHAAELLVRSMNENTRQAAADRGRTFRRETGEIDLSGAADRNNH